MKKFSWSLNEDTEIFLYDGDTIEECIRAALALRMEENPEASVPTVYIGTNTPPHISVSTLVENVEEQIACDLYDQCGEASDSWELTQAKRDELKAFLEGLVGKLEFGCWTVEDVRPYGPEAPEYKAAVVAMTRQ